MLNFGRKFRALRDQKIYILTLVLSEKKILNERKNHNPPPPPPLQVKWSAPYILFKGKTLNLQPSVSIIPFDAINTSDHTLIKVEIT